MPSVAKLPDRQAELPLLFRPVAEHVRICVDSADKKLSDLTVAELVSWATVVGYCLGVGVIAGHLGALVIRGAVRPPMVIRALTG